MSGVHTPTHNPSIYAPPDDGVEWASTATADPWDPAILTLDGGGIRGYSSLLILKALMHEIAVWEKKLEKEEREKEREDANPMSLVTSDDLLVVPSADSGDLERPGARRTSRSSQSSDRGRLSARALGSETFNAPQVSSPLRNETVRGSSGLGSSPEHSRNRRASSASHSSLGIPNGGPAEALLPPRPQDVKDSESTPEGLTEFEDNLLPCHYFDFMYGTSTGGLIATMLGRLRMSVPQCLKIYREVSESLFGRRRSTLPLRTKYYAAPLEQAVKNIVAQYCKQHGQTPPDACKGDDWFPWNASYAGTHLDEEGVDFDHHICQSICLAAVHNGRIDLAHLLRTFDQHYSNIPDWTQPYNEGADRLRIWQVTRATSAAPFYFKALQAEIGHEPWEFKDGGIRENNPAGAAWSEYVSMFGNPEDPAPALLLSVGTGRPNEERDGFAAAWPGPLGNSKLLKQWAEKFAVLKNVLVKYTAGEQKHESLKNTARGEHKWYKRLNVTEGLESLPLDHWQRGGWADPATGETSVVPGGATLTLLEEATQKYLARDWDAGLDSYASPNVKLTQTAEKLVRQRRAREKLAKEGIDSKRWDTYVGKYLRGTFSPEPDAPLKTV